MDLEKDVASIVILNFNGAELLKKYIPSIIQNTPSNINIYVIDNGSTDDSIHVLKQFPEIKVIALDKNLGFAEGYNQGLKSIRSKYIALLNSDILVKEDWLSPLVNFMEKNPKVGTCQPKILSLNQPELFEYAGAAGGFIDYMGYPFCRGRIFDEVESDVGQYNARQRTFWASGAAMVVRSDVFEESGGFDADFFAHMEEIDLCWRIQRLGYEIYCMPEKSVYHLGGGTLNYGSPGKTYLNFRNNLIMLLKNLPANQVFKVIIMRMILDGFAGLSFILKGQFRHFFAILKAHFTFYSTIGRTLKKRRRFIDKNLKNGLEGDIHGILQKSIVWQYFIKKKNKYSELEKNIR